MDIASIIKAVLTSGEDRTGPGMGDLQPGDRLNGRVLKVESDGRVLMDLGGRQALARIGFSVQSGQTLPLQVVENGSLLHLQIDPSATAGKTKVTLPTLDFQKVLTPSDRERLIGMVKGLLTPYASTSSKSALPESIRSALTRVITLFEPVPVEGTVRELSQWVKGEVEDRGLLFEKKLGEVAAESRAGRDSNSEKAAPNNLARAIITRDVKSQLLMLRQFLQSTGEQLPLMDKLDVKSAAFLRHAIDQLLGHIETQQEHAIPRWTEGESQQVFVHTMHLPEQKNPLKLKVYYPRKEGDSGGKGPHRIALLLDMDRLGPLRVDLSMQERILRVVFYTAHQKTLDLIGDEVTTVSDSLSGLFEHVAVDCFMSRDKIVDFEIEDAKESGGGRIDLSV